MAMQGNIQEKPLWTELAQMFRDYLKGSPQHVPAALSNRLDFCGNHLTTRAETEKNTNTWIQSRSAGE